MEEVEIEGNNPDTYVLLKSVEGMMDLIQTQAKYYNDARQRLVEEHLKKPTLSFVESDPFYVEPAYTEMDLNELKKKMAILAARLKQLSMERENARQQTETAFEQLRSENRYLREELTRLRREYLIPKDKEFDE